MTPIYTQWLAILLSSVGVFIVSSIIHMLLPWHKNDYPKLPDEEKFREALKPLNIPRGDYMVPRTMGTTEMRSPEFQQKLKEGPVMMITVRNSGPFSMTSNLILWFIYSVVVGIFAAYITGRALPPGAMYLHVFRFAGATAFIGYSVALWQMSIWWSRSWMMTLKSTIDGLIYGLVTAGFFGWLWPR